MKKHLIRIGISVICLIALFGVIVLGQILYILNGSRKIGSRMSFDREEFVLSVDDDNDIRILQIADTQITALGDSLKSFGPVKRIVEKTKPDLIVLTGDNLMNDSTKMMLRHYVRFFDKFQIPWAPIMGNHDYQTKMTMEEQCEIYENGKYCLFKKGDVADSYGNYYYNIQRNGRIVHSLIFMDNGLKISEEQLNWYENTINTIKANNSGNILPSWTFVHKPLLETYQAYYDSLYGYTTLEGECREGIAYLRDDAGLFDKVVEMQSTTSIIYGHNHRNNYSVKYRDVTLSFGTKTGKTSYHDEDLIGGNVYTLKSDNTFTIERVLI